MQPRASNNNELIDFFNKQDKSWFLIHAASLIAIPAAGFTIAAQVAAKHPIISILATSIAILDIAEPFYANYYNKPGPFMQTTSLMYRAGSSAYQTFFGAKPATNNTENVKQDFKPTPSRVA